jgi:hypothetical protein
MTSGNSRGKFLGALQRAQCCATRRPVPADEQHAFLRNHACDEMQGYLFSEPLPAPRLARLLRAPPMLVSPPLVPDAEGVAKSVPPSRRKRAVV